MQRREFEKFITQMITQDVMPILHDNYAELVTQAEQQGENFFNNDGNTASFKNDGKGLVSLGEIKAEEKIREIFSKHYPDISILGEELGDTDNLKDYTLVIDPVDGTSAMILSAINPNNHLGFGITIGLLKGKLFHGGMIFELKPDAENRLTLGDIWSGWHNDELLCNGKPYNIAPTIDKEFKTLISSAPEVMFTNKHEKSAFHSLEKTASEISLNKNCMGFIDALKNPQSLAIEADLSIHDIAALIPIMKSADLGVSDHNGKDIEFINAEQEFKIIAAPKPIHSHALELYKTALSNKPIEINSASVLNRHSLNTQKYKT